MNIPDTDNEAHRFAFNKGYRTAQQGKPLSNIPGTMRSDPQMRMYFHMGWDQFQQDLENAEEAERTESPWIKRAIWLVTMVLGGIATGMIMIDNIEKSREPTQMVDTTQSIGNNSTAKSNDLSLSLLSDHARSDLAETKQDEQVEKRPLDPIVESTIRIETAQFTSAIKDKNVTDTFEGTVPKFIRELYFFTQIANAENSQIQHRWLHNGQIMATIPLTVSGDSFRTWSSKKLSSAWSGTWHVEVLNAENQVIYRASFNYIQ